MVSLEDRGHVQVDEAVVVVVARRHRAAPVPALEPGPRGDVREPTLAIVAVEAIARPPLSLLLSLQGRAVDHEQIEQAVAVAVEPRRAVARGLDDVRLPGPPEEVAVVDPRPGGGVLELNWAIRRGHGHRGRPGAKRHPGQGESAGDGDDRGLRALRPRPCHSGRNDNRCLRTPSAGATGRTRW